MAGWNQNTNPPAFGSSSFPFSFQASTPSLTFPLQSFSSHIHGPAQEQGPSVGATTTREVPARSSSRPVMNPLQPAQSEPAVLQYQRGRGFLCWAGENDWGERGGVYSEFRGARGGMRTGVVRAGDVGPSLAGSASLPFRACTSAPMYASMSASSPAYLSTAMALPPRRREESMVVDDAILVKREESPEDMKVLDLDLGSSRYSVMSREDFPNLGSLDLKTLTSDQSLFYFGVLSLQALLLPRFHYEVGQYKKGQKWRARLTMYGLTIAHPKRFFSQKEAREKACTEALDVIKPEFLEWTVPGEPMANVYIKGWDWCDLLKDYCVQNGLPEPNYKKWIHLGEYHHEIEIQGSSYSDTLNQCTKEGDSRNSAAHVALHSLLIFGTSLLRFPGPVNLRTADENILAQVPRVPSVGLKAIGSNPAPKRAAEVHAISGPSKRTRRKKTGFATGPADSSSGTQANTVKLNVNRLMERRTSGQTGIDANLLPLSNNTVQPVESAVPAEDKRWKMTPREIEAKITDLGTQTERLTKVCQLLSLDQPDIRIESNEGRLIETDAKYTVAAYFQGDPFFARVGAIGEVKHDDRQVAKERCARATIGYILNMVSEDLGLYEEAHRKRQERGLWVGDSLDKYITGLVDGNPGDGMDVE